MSKEEVALELTKLIAEKIGSALGSQRDNESIYSEKIVAAYNYILENMTFPN